MGVIWTVLVAAAVVAAAVNGRMASLTTAAVESAGRAVTLSIGLAGVMALWLGLVRVADEAGLVRALARAFRPVLRLLFPSVPVDHPALGAVVMNVSATALGLGNAATPFGIKAMQELETLNPHPGTATDAQAMLCAINTASIQLVPATVIALRAAAGSRAPGEILGPTLLASLCGAATAVFAAKALRRMFPVRGTSATASATAAGASRLCSPPASSRRFTTSESGGEPPDSPPPTGEDAAA